MRGTATVLHPEKVIVLTQWPGEWMLAKDDLLAPSQTDTPAADATDKAIPAVEPEWEWIQENEDSLRADYAARWIAVLLNRVVAVGADELDVLRNAEALGYGNVFTFYVPTDSEPVAMAGSEL